MQWTNGYYLEWHDGKLVVECDARQTSRLVYARIGPSLVGLWHQTPRPTPYLCREFGYKYRGNVGAPGRKSKHDGQFRGRKRAARKLRAVAARLPQPIAEEMAANMEYGLTLEQWRSEARGRYPAEVPLDFCHLKRASQDKNANVPTIQHQSRLYGHSHGIRAPLAAAAKRHLQE